MILFFYLILRFNRKKKGANMKPKRYPYSGNKKQPHEEIAELRYELNVLKNNLSTLAHQLFKN